jgi:hypothetical protein
MASIKWLPDFGHEFHFFCSVCTEKIDTNTCLLFRLASNVYFFLSVHSSLRLFSTIIQCTQLSISVVCAYYHSCVVCNISALFIYNCVMENSLILKLICQLPACSYTYFPYRCQGEISRMMKSLNCILIIGYTVPLSAS